MILIWIIGIKEADIAAENAAEVNDAILVKVDIMLIR